MNENKITSKSLKGYSFPEAEIIKIASVDIIRTSDEWDLPEIPVDSRERSLDIGI